jgi:hypothetical protein
VFKDGRNILKMGTPASKMSLGAVVLRQGRQFRKQCVSVFGWLEWNFTDGEFSDSQNAGRNVFKEVAIIWKNRDRSVD